MTAVEVPGWGARTRRPVVDYLGSYLYVAVRHAVET